MATKDVIYENTFEVDIRKMVLKQIEYAIEGSSRLQEALKTIEYLYKLMFRLKKKKIGETAKEIDGELYYEGEELYYEDKESAKENYVSSEDYSIERIIKRLERIERNESGLPEYLKEIEEIIKEIYSMRKKRTLRSIHGIQRINDEDNQYILRINGEDIQCILRINGEDNQRILRINGEDIRFNLKNLAQIEDLAQVEDVSQVEDLSQLEELVKKIRKNLYNKYGIAKVFSSKKIYRKEGI